jgi:hypothetical protein
MRGSDPRAGAFREGFGKERKRLRSKSPNLLKEAFRKGYDKVKPGLAGTNFVSKLELTL